MKNLTFSILQKWTGIIFIALFSFSAKAQNQKLFPKNLNFKVSNTYYGQGDSCYVFIYEGGKLGVKIGQQGKVYGVHSNEKPNRSQKELGFSTIVRIMGDTIIAKTTLYKPTITDEKVAIGDYLVLEINLPINNYNSLFYDLALMQITFTDVSKTPLYSLKQILTKDSKALEDSILIKSIADIKEIYDRVKDDESFTSLRVKMPEGRYAGKTTLEVMSKTTKADIIAFLKFVKSYPGKYVGNQYKIAEVFATWVVNKAPLNNQEVLDSVRYYATNKIKYDKFLTVNRITIVKDEYLKSWSIIANDLAIDGKAAEADALLKEVEKAGTSLNDTSGLGFYYYIAAQILQDKQQYAQAIVHVNKAIDLFKQSKYWEFYIKLKLKRIYIEIMLTDFVASEKTYKELTTDFAELKSQMEGNLYKELIAQHYGYYGFSLKRKGDLNEAKTFYQKSADQYNLLEDFSSKVQSALARENVADIETTQNNYEGSIPLYDSLIVAYKRMNQSAKQSYALNSKAYALSKMGQYDKNISNANEALAIQLKNADWNKAGYSYSQIGQSYFSLGKFKDAVNAHQQSILYRRKGNNFEGMGYSYSKLGSLYIEIGDKLKAIAALDSAKFCYTKANLKDKLAEIDGSIGDIYLSDKNVPKAVAYFLSAYESLKTLGLKQEMAKQLYNIAGATYTDDMPQSRKYYQLAYDLYKEIGIKDQVLYCLLNLGNLDTREKKYESAEKYFNQALVLSKEINGKREQAITYQKLADAAYTKLNLTDAILKYEQALAIYKEIDEKAEVANISIAIGSVNVSLGKFIEAEIAMQQALDISKTTNNYGGKADALSSLSDLYQLKGQFSTSKTMLDSCFKIYKQLGNSYQIANTHILLGNYYNRLSDNINAIKNYSTADSIFKAEKSPESRFTSLNNIGTIYFYQADYPQALNYFNQANAIIANQTVITDSKLLVITNIGEVYYHQKNYPEAEKNLALALKFSSEKNAVRSKSSATMVLGKLFYDKKDYPNAITNLQNSYQYAKSTKENSQLIESSLYLGKVSLAMKKEDEAAKYFDEAIVNSIRVGEAKNLWEALYNRGLMFYNQNKLDSAANYFKQAVNSVEQTGKNIFGGAAAKKIFTSDEKKVNLYNTLISTLIKAGKTDEALEYTSRSNIQAIKEKMGQIEVKTNNVEKATALQQQNQLANKVNSVEENLAKEKAKPADEQNKEKINSLQKVQQIAQVQLLNFVDSMVKAYPDLQENFVKNVNPEDLKKYKSKIPEDVAVLLYVVRENQLIIFTLTKEGTKAKLIPISGADLSSNISDFSAVLKQPFKDKNAAPLNLRGAKITNTVQSSRSVAETGSNLYQVLIDPILSDIAGKKQLCIINNGELSSIPFQAIGKKDEKGTFRYLVEDYAIFYTNRLDVFSNVQPDSVKNSSFVAYGNPDHSLPNAEKEVKEINKIMTSGTIYVGDLATEDMAKKSLTSNKIVHFATHGILDYNDFSKTFLKFAKSTTNDGKLTIQEIKGLDIEDCDLVTLSACETAVSLSVNKGWYISPANSFLVNGVKSVVASLWSVDDEATSLLMSSFYQNLKNMPKAQALRKAQETLSQNPKFVHPFYWSAFILYGEWR
ncbi:CHAT domain-containing protein [Pedobacter sp. LMG 31464]|uniref:CHAT domain-containing protein n=1 Tax=Pedobacter planticolens TaxID=2679964 RepID=A0A923DZ20_9SPHI|nr:CHAT domain-containing protein [Pedobacter planticolens]MBB2144532.1 CHAT domain-containing protein [Pedobacter planticolens]